jgi:hypothetical protein
MNTIDATPHISVGDVSPCSVGATCSLNCRSVLIPRNECTRSARRAPLRNEAIATPSMKSPKSSGAAPLRAARKRFAMSVADPRSVRRRQARPDPGDDGTDDWRAAQQRFRWWPTRWNRPNSSTTAVGTSRSTSKVSVKPRANAMLVHCLRMPNGGRMFTCCDVADFISSAARLEKIAAVLLRRRIFIHG